MAHDPLPSDDSALAARVRAGDLQAFEAMFRSYHGRLCAFAFGYVADQDVAVDIVSDVFLSIWVSRLEWRLTGSVQSYLFSATRNRSLNYLRGMRREAARYDGLHVGGNVPGMANDIDAPDDELSWRDGTGKDTARDAIIWDAINQLNERARTVMTLRWREQMRVADIAATLGISAGAVDKIQRRALDTLARMLPDLLE
jgi:RNA polymerase sigma-70 factor (ECF subfamily)